MVYPGKNRTLFVAALVLLFSFAPAALSVDPKGLVVSGDSKDNISVTLDPELIPYVHKDLEQGKTIIRLPEEVSQNLRLKVDPALRSQGVVDLGKNGRGLILKINSENVYFGIQDLSEQPLDEVMPVPAKKPAEKEKIAEKPVAEKKVPPVPHAAEKPVEKTPEKVSEKPSPKQSPPVKPELMQPTVSSIGLNMDLKPVELGSQINQALLTPPETQDLTGDILDSTDVSFNAGLPDDMIWADSELEPAVDLDTLLKETNEEVPLELLESYRAQKEVASTGMLVRIILSLAAVLLMIVGFTRWVLPKLVQRYPALFPDRSREQSQARPFPIKTKPMPADDQPSPGNNILGSLLGWRKKAEKPSADPGKKVYLQKLKKGGDQFQVLTSTKLGKNKELHLVEIRGRHLVVATTPYTINLIADLDHNEERGHTPEDWAESEEAEALISQEECRKREIIAYLEDSKPEIPQPPPAKEHAKAYGSKPFERLASIATNQDLYKKYLNPEELMGHSGDGKKSRLQKPEPASQAGAAFVEAEEVIVLEDYDDVYRS